MRVKFRHLLLKSIAALLVLAVLFALYLLPGSTKALFTKKPEQTEGFEKPIVINKGGTYSGNWESWDSEVAAIEISTSEPVVIENSIIRGAGYLIRSKADGANITIRNTKGYGLPPTPWVLYEKPRRFLISSSFKNIVVENCYLENTAGIYLGDDYKGDGSPAQTIKIRYNKVKNIDGRIYEGWYASQFVQFNFRNPVQHAEIAWNEVINEPDNSLVEDNINVYNSRGTPAFPILIHNNYIQGAFPIPATAKDYTGGGILADSPESEAATATAHLRIFENQLVGLGNYCIGIAGGNHIEVYQNRAIVSGMISEQTPLSCWTSGIWSKDFYNTGATFKNIFRHNVLGVAGQGRTWRNDIMKEIQETSLAQGNFKLSGEISLATERNEYQIWKNKLQRNKILLGPKTYASMDNY